MDLAPERHICTIDASVGRKNAFGKIVVKPTEPDPQDGKCVPTVRIRADRKPGLDPATKAKCMRMILRGLDRRRQPRFIDEHVVVRCR